jgi:hypothetical protein
MEVGGHDKNGSFGDPGNNFCEKNFGPEYLNVKKADQHAKKPPVHINNQQVLQCCGFGIPEFSNQQRGKK